MVKNSNVVINLLGPRKYAKNRDDFDFVNVDLAERIAKACKKKGVMRLVHFSAAAANPDSESLDFKTKFIGEQAVRAEFPDATIIRPTLMYGIGDYFASIALRQSLFFFHKFVPVYDDCTTLKQPIREHDVSQCVLNALKLDETKGKTYELGGPHKLTTLEMYENIFNTLNVNPALAYVNKDLSLAIAKKIYNW